MPETSDSDFDWKSLIDCSNNELKNNLGNFCNRVIVFVRIPKPYVHSQI